MSGDMQHLVIEGRGGPRTEERKDVRTSDWRATASLIS